MDKQIQLHQMMEQEYQRCARLYNQLTERVQPLTVGSLQEIEGSFFHRIKENGKQYKIKIERDDDLLNSLKYKRFAKSGLPLLKKRMDACERFLKNEVYYDPYKIETELPKQYHGLQNMDVFLDEDLKLAEWDQNIYERNPYPFKSIHYTSAGVACRSKSEALIGTRLEERGLLYRYEPRLVLQNRVIYPDFEILLPRRRRLVYLEHFGMIDKAKYATEQFYRLNEYELNGYYLGVNLFYTFETANDPLNMKRIDRKLNEIMRLDYYP